MPDLSVVDINAIPPPDALYKIHWDDTLKGFGVRINPKSIKYPNGKRLFIAMGRIKSKPTILTVGPCELMVEPEARKRAAISLKIMRDGRRPNGTDFEESVHDELIRIKALLDKVTKERDLLLVLTRQIEKDRDEMRAYIEQEK